MVELYGMIDICLVLKVQCKSMYSILHFVLYNENTFTHTCKSYLMKDILETDNTDCLQGEELLDILPKHILTREKRSVCVKKQNLIVKLSKDEHLEQTPEI